jgi:hypothetical protein
LSDHPLKPTRLEIAAGTVAGEEPAELPDVPAGLTPRRALEDVVLAALQREPCVVTFSGGRDSSAVLALAVSVARREGLPLPLPVTVRFAHAPGAGEDRWQELVVRHLGLADWEVIQAGDDLDVLGPVAQGIIRRHGVVHPVNAPLYAVLLRRAAGGSLLTGFGGDQMLGTSWRLRWAELSRGRLPRPSDLGPLAYLTLPRALRRRLAHRHATRPPWLRPQAAEELARVQATALSTLPARFSRQVLWHRRRRVLACSHYTFQLLARDEDVLCLHPLTDPAFLASWARAGGWRGFGDRTASLRVLVPDVLPPEVLERTGKAVFHYVYFRDTFRAFARSWDGTGVDSELVDAERLREAALQLTPNAFTAFPLQAAWLASAGREPDEQLEHGVEGLEARGPA